jgi:ribosome-associated protein
LPLIKFPGLAKSGAEAKALLETGQVSVGGVKCLVLRKKIRPGDIVSLGEKTELLVEKEKRV